MLHRSVRGFFSMQCETSFKPIPFFVVDRPMSLKILEHCEINNQAFKLGLMGHANTSQEFQVLFRNFNHQNVEKIVDSGVFTKNGCMNGYSSLFSTYEKMGADYGIMIDILKDKEKTIESAQKAINAYRLEKYSFKLIGVAQGNTVDEYQECYRDLKEIGYEYIAIGGLLKKAENTARYVKVHDEKLLKNVVSKIRSQYSKDWLFLLGSYHPQRHRIFEKFKIFGGDYKGWIFQYTPPEDRIKKDHLFLSVMESSSSKNLIDPTVLEERAKINENLHSKDISLTEKNQLRLNIRLLDKTISELREKNANNFGEEYLSRIQSIQMIYNSSEDQLRKFRFAQVKNYIESQVYSNFRKRLLIIGCSDKKNPIIGLTSAISLYNGPNYLSLKKLKREHMFPSDVQIVIISAKYGMIFPDQWIEKYDKKMTITRAEELKNELKRKLETYLKEKKFEECFINLGKTYMRSIESVQFPLDIQKIEAKGKIGEKRSEMLKWLLRSENK
jgi:two-component sensor histidine kinase